MLLSKAGGFPFKPGVAYTGPGDIVSGAYGWWGLRGYTAAYSTGSNPALDLVDQANANPITINILANGRLDVASISAWVTANSVSTIKVKRMYDQTGNARHMNQATLANMPTLNLTGFGSLPAVVFTAASSQSLTAGSPTRTGPLTGSMVWNRTGGGVDTEPTYWGVTVLAQTANNLRINNGANLDLAATTGSWHASQMVFNGASSAIYTDGTSATGSTGTVPTTGSAGLLMGAPAVSNYYNGSIAEVGWWGTTAINSTQAGNLNTNQHGTNGYNF